MKYIKYFEHEPYIYKYLPGTYIMVKSKRLEFYNEPMIVKSWDGYHFACILINPEFNIDINVEWYITEKEIIRKLTQEEINHLQLQKQADKYNL